MKKLLLLLCAAVYAQPALDAPPVANVLDSDGLVTAIYGLAGNFIPGPPGPALFAYSNDGAIEWKLGPGRLSATRDGQTAVFATTAISAEFRGEFALLPESNEVLRLVSEAIVSSSDEPDSRVAGRLIAWRDGKLQIEQPGGAVEEVECPAEPSGITAAASDWVHLNAGGQAHLLRLTPGRVELFVLPKRGRP